MCTIVLAFILLSLISMCVCDDEDTFLKKACTVRMPPNNKIYNPNF